MNDYSDIILLMGAMIVFSLLSIQTSRLFQMNNRMQINGEIEYNAVSIAQDQIDKLQWIKNKSGFNSFVDTFPKDVPVANEGDTLFYHVDVETSAITIPHSNIDNKQVNVTVTNDYLKTNEQEAAGTRAVRLQFIKSFN